VFPGVPQEVHQGQPTQPIGIVPQTRRIPLTIKPQEMGKLVPNRLCVPIDLLERQYRSLVPLPTGVADHAGSPTDQDDRSVAEPLQPGRAYDGHQTAHVKGIGCRIETYVPGEGSLSQPLRQASRGILQQTTLLQCLKEVGHRRQCYPLESSLAIG
jgi:hypothetical protein